MTDLIESLTFNTPTFTTPSPALRFNDSTQIIFPFGPPIYQTFVPQDFAALLIEEGRKLNVEDDDYAFQLAGNYKYGRSFQYHEDFRNQCAPYLLSVCNDFMGGLEQVYGPSSTAPVRNRGVILDDLWINFAQKHDWNPAHKHAGLFSFAIFCDVPERIFSVQADSNEQHAGQLIFQYGEETCRFMNTHFIAKPMNNLMFMFPNTLKHFVPPYWVDAERISVSGNITYADDPMSSANINKGDIT